MTSMLHPGYSFFSHNLRSATITGMTLMQTIAYWTLQSGVSERSPSNQGMQSDAQEQLRG